MHLVCTLLIKVGLRWVFVNGLKWAQKCVLGYKNGSKVGRNLSPTLSPFWDFRENPLSGQFKGGVEIVL